MAHDDEYTWISAQAVIKGLVIEVLFLDRDLLLGHLHRLHDGLEHDIWLYDLALREGYKLSVCVLGAEGISVAKQDVGSIWLRANIRASNH